MIMAEPKTDCKTCNNYNACFQDAPNIINLTISYDKSDDDKSILIVGDETNTTALNMITGEMADKIFRMLTEIDYTEFQPIEKGEKNWKILSSGLHLESAANAEEILTAKNHARSTNECLKSFLERKL